MNIEMAYLLGMILGNGEIQRTQRETTIVINIPHKKLETEEIHDVKLYVKASISDIRNVIEPLIGTGLLFYQNDSSTILTFTKKNEDYLIREINRYIGNVTSHNRMRIHDEVLNASLDEQKYFIRGLADVTGYIRRSNAYFQKFEHRVYIEVPNNWELVIDICNLLKSLDIPIQTIEWAHPNMRDGNLEAYLKNKKKFWKKEHQIKIWANEFIKIGFGIIHKQQALEMFNAELLNGYESLGKDLRQKTHRYYWEMKKKRNKIKPNHPEEHDEFIPRKIRGKHFNSWYEIAKELGYEK